MRLRLHGRACKAKKEEEGDRQSSSSFIGRLGGRKRYCPEDLPLRSIPPRLTARCLPLTAAGGQGPQDNTAYDYAHITHLTARCLPLTAAGGQGPLDNTACDPGRPFHPSKYRLP